MASLVHLVRHAEVENPDHLVYASLPGFRLSERGRRQARAAARYLGSRPIVAVWSSPLERALETAGVIAERAAAPVRVDSDLEEWRLAERWSGIRWEDLPDERPGELEGYLEHPHDLPFSDESLDDLARRMADTVVALHHRHPEGDVVVVSHQDPVQAGRLRLTGGDLRRLNGDKPGHAAVISLRPGSPWREEVRWEPEEQAEFPPRSAITEDAE
ncbi:MAG: histidine phosphatase family protein [Acidimicrobiia bacterium]|jgi:broad specificity phosphatase PhoE